jgi:alpha-beta hydrolase superfamily lysophospholipase
MSTSGPPRASNPPSQLALIRFRRADKVRMGLALARDAARGALAKSSLEDVGAEILVRAPNAGRPRPTSPLPGELLVEVGPPSATLSMTIVDAPRPRGTVFVLHGIRDSKEAMRGWGEMLARMGLRAVLVDLRGHGRSSGEVLTYGVQESFDLMRVLDALQARGRLVGPVGVMGYSYGAATAIQWAGRDERIDAVVAVAPFSSLREVVPSYLPVRFPGAFVQRTIDLAGVRGGFDPDEANTALAMSKTRAAVLLVHGRSDARIPFAHSERIFAARRKNTELVLIAGAGHESVATHRGTSLEKRTRTWFSDERSTRLASPVDDA